MTSMNPPTTEDNGGGEGSMKPDKFEEQLVVIDDKLKDQTGPLYHCDLYDADIAHKIAQEFLPGFASSCIDNTTGALFSNPASVAVDIRTEMVHYLIQRSENFVAETVLLNADPHAQLSDDPYDIISNFIDDFATSKQSLFSRVSGWLLSERREDRIDDFVQEMEINGFWLLNARESVAQTLLKNIDFKNLHHCNMNFKSPQDLEHHKSTCNFRTMTCLNEGCDYRFSASQMEQHDSICPFKILNCEQNCSESIMRREMDRHCITICPMKLVKCPFYSIGCVSSIPQSKINQHRSDDLRSHLLHILKGIHKQVSEQDLKERVEELCKVSSPGNLASARDARSLAYAIKDLEAKLGPLKVHETPKPSDEVNGSSTDKKEESTVQATKVVRFEETPRKDEGEETTVTSPSKSIGLNDPSRTNENVIESQHEVINIELVEPISVEKSLNESPHEREDGLDSLNKVEVQIEKSNVEEVAELVKDEHFASPIKIEENTDSLVNRETHADSAVDNEESTKSPQMEEESKELSNYAEKISNESPLQSEKALGSPDKGEMHIENSAVKKVVEPAGNEHVTTPIKVEDDRSSVDNEKDADSVNLETKESTKSLPKEEPTEPSNSEMSNEPSLVNEKPDF